MESLHLSRPSSEVILLTLDRPEKLNALSFDVVEELHAALDEIAADNSCRVVVLTGAGRGFCSGLDLSNIGPSPAAAGTTGPRSGMISQQRIAEIPIKLRRLQQPVIAAVNGPAYGGGFAIALACDMRIASTSARFCSQFIKLGVSGCDIGISYTLPRLIGSGRAFDLLLTARVIDADEAQRLGIVTDVVEDGTVVERALAIAETICSYSAFGVVMTKEIMWSNLDAPSMDSAIHLENRTQILAGFGGEIMEAAERFMQGRAKDSHPQRSSVE